MSSIVMSIAIGRKFTIGVRVIPICKTSCVAKSSVCNIKNLISVRFARFII
jgi:hypothetical protein